MILYLSQKTIPMKKLALLLFAGALSVNFALAQPKTSGKQLKEFDAWVENARKEWGAVGLAVTVIKDNEVIFKKGYGLRQLGTHDAVDTNTLFACASTTKAMTATCMGMLVDEGKVNWDDRVIQYLPGFQLYDPYVTRELRIRTFSCTTVVWEIPTSFGALWISVATTFWKRCDGSSPAIRLGLGLFTRISFTSWPAR